MSTLFMFASCEQKRNAEPANSRYEYKYTIEQLRENFSDEMVGAAKEEIKELEEHLKERQQ